MGGKHYVKCLVCRITKEDNPEVKFFIIPKNSPKREIWLKSIHRYDLINTKISRDHRVCEKHFTDEMFGESTSRLNRDAVPQADYALIPSQQEEVLQLSGQRENLSIEHNIVSNQPERAVLDAPSLEETQGVVQNYTIVSSPQEEAVFEPPRLEEMQSIEFFDVFGTAHTSTQTIKEVISASTNTAPIIRPQTSQGIQSNNLNCLSKTSQIIITPMSKPLTRVQQNDNNLSFMINPSNVVFQLPNNSAPLIPIKPPTPPMPKISAVHSQYTAETLVTSKVCKIDFTHKDIEDNPKIYLGIEKKELSIMKVLSNSCQLTQTQIFLILRKMRHHEPVEILADQFGMHPDQVVQTIIDYAPKMACMFRKCLKFASMKANRIDCVLKRIQIAVYKPSYLTDQPEEISRYSKKVELSYLVSCTQIGFVNFVSKGLEMSTKQNNNISELFKFINNANPKSVHIVGKRFGKINKSYLAHRNVKVKRSPPSISCKMHLIRVFDEINQFKILANSKIPLRYEFFSIVDDFFVIACGLYNCKLM